MSLRHALLGLLAVQPSTGYEVTQRFDLSLRHAWHAGHSQIYPELAKLDDEGLAEVIGQGARNSRTWAVTPAGRDELRRWLVEVEPNRSVRNETAVRWFLVMLLDPPDRRLVFARELADLEGELGNLQELAARLDGQGGPSHFRPVVELGLRSTAVMRDWLQEQLEAASE